ncbi:DUF1449 family protein [Novosphingobium sp. ZN18A2]|uniref:OB-fold-containig protein n=1 Tax=Novosphingobium sp. ZN18A2 TaxID=3079861 RepID=UPI0030D39F78
MNDVIIHYRAPLAIALAVIAALAVAFIARRVRSRGRHGPEPAEALVGRRAAITSGTARRGAPAGAAVTDRFGHMHDVMVEPHVDEENLEEGDAVLLVHFDGALFYAMGESPLVRD